jgi:hypothetical protein
MLESEFELLVGEAQFFVFSQKLFTRGADFFVGGR